MFAYKKETAYLTSNEQKIFYHHYTTDSSNDRCLLLLNGARLGGRQTWEPIIPILKYWSQIIVLEIRGTGELNSVNTNNDMFTDNDIINDIERLLKQYQWNYFDQVGYSFGGFIAMLLKVKLQDRIQKNILIESALIAEVDEYLSVFISALKQIVELMAIDPKQGNDLFSTLISSKLQSPLLKELSAKSKIHNPLGFANLMRILIKYCEDPELRWRIIEKQDLVINLITEYAPSGTHAMAKVITQRCNHWQFQYISNTDHSLPFAKPEATANLINQLYSSLDSSLKLDF